MTPINQLPILHIKATHNNTMITITDHTGHTVAWTSAVSGQLNVWMCKLVFFLSRELKGLKMLEEVLHLLLNPLEHLLGW